MTALAKGHVVKERLAPQGRRFPVAASTIIYQGAIVALTAAAANSVAKGATADATLTVVGCAMATADNRTGLAKAIDVETRRGIFLLANSATDPVTIGHLGKTVYAEDDFTISKTGAPDTGTPTQPVAGTLYDVDPSGGVWIEFK